MKKISVAFTGLVLTLPLLVSCNIYKPFTSDSSDQDHEEIALVDLQNGDYADAITEYQKLSDPTLQNQMVCEVQISEAGVTLSVLANEFTGSFSQLTVLGDLANAIGPWSSVKSTTAASAITTCNNYTTAVGTTDLSTLLQTAAYIADISLHMAHAAVCICDSETDTSCETTAPSLTVDQADIGGDSNGVISSGNPGMCNSDAQAILTDFLALNPLLKNSQLTGLVNLYNTVTSNGTSGLAQSSTVPDTVRSLLKGFVPQ